MKRIALIGGALLGLLLLSALALPFLIDPNTFRPMLEARLSEALGRAVKLGDLKLSILSGSVTANDLSIADDPAFSRTPFVAAKSLAIGVELWPLIKSRQVRVTSFTIEQPAIALIQAPNGDWNFSNLGGEKAAARRTQTPDSTGKTPMDLSVKLIKITGGRFSLGNTAGHAKPLVLEDVNLEVRDFSPAAAFPFTFATKVAGGGAIKLDGKFGPLDAKDVAASPLTANLDIDKLDLAGTGVTQSAPAIAGLLGLQATIESNGTRAQVKGKLKGDNLKLAKAGTPAKRPVELAFNVDHNLRRNSGRIRQGAIKIGSAPANLTGTYATDGDDTVVKMNLDGPNMPVPELASLLPALGVVLPNGSSLEGGTASVKLAMQGALAKLVTTGTVSLDNTRLAHFDMGKKLETIQMLAGMKGGPDTDIQTLGATVRVAPEGTTADNLRLIVPSIGNLEGSGTVSPDKILDFKMRATVHTAGLLAAVGNTPIPFTVAGPATDPVFRPDMKSIAREELKKYTGGDSVGKATDLIKGLFGNKDKKK